MVVKYIPDRGDIVWLDFNPQKGHEQAGSRPAIILSPKNYNQSSQLMLACPITSKVKNYPFEVRIKTRKINGVILSDQIKNLDWKAKDISFVERVTGEILEQTQDFIEALLRG